MSRSPIDDRYVRPCSHRALSLVGEIHVQTHVIHHRVLSLITESCKGDLRSSRWSTKQPGRVRQVLLEMPMMG